MGDFSSAARLRQLSSRSEWAVNALHEVLLSVPCCTPSRPSGLVLRGDDCLLCFEDGERVQLAVPAVVRPFLGKVATVLVVSFVRTNIVNEIDVFVTHDEAFSGVDADA